MATEISRLALVGANGMLARMVRDEAPGKYEIVPLDLPEFDITRREVVTRTMEAIHPKVIVNCAAYTNVDGCESNEDVASMVNGRGPGYLAEAAKEIGATLVHISTDYVFDGLKREPYVEEDPTSPVSAYGRSKLQGEIAILASGLERFFILRTSWLYGPGGKNFVETIARLGKEREELRIVADQVGSPTYTEDLAKGIFQLLNLVKEGGNSSRIPHLASQPFGIYHFANEGSCSWHEFACAILAKAKAAGEPIVTKHVLPIRTEEYPLPAVRPAYSVFSKNKYEQAVRERIPEWREALAAYFRIRS
jgi:dTDP-4-dehydrorhamnose reductase